MPQFYAYIYRDPSRNFQPIYCGKGQDDRAYEHLKNRDKPYEKENKSFMGRLRNMKEAGVEPVIQIFNCESEELAFLFEEEAIDKYGRIDLGKGPLHNHTNGGEGTSGYIHTVEAREKQSQAKKGKPRSLQARKKISDTQKGRPSPKKGKPLSAAHRQKLTDGQKGKPKLIVTCPHCGTEGGKGIMHRWHFDKCKHKKVS